MPELIPKDTVRKVDGQKNVKEQLLGKNKMCAFIDM